MAVMMMMTTKSLKCILQANLLDDEGGAGVDGGLWPTDLLHCDDQSLVSLFSHPMQINTMQSNTFVTL